MTTLINSYIPRIPQWFHVLLPQMTSCNFISLYIWTTPNIAFNTSCILWLQIIHVNSKFIMQLALATERDKRTIIIEWYHTYVHQMASHVKLPTPLIFGCVFLCCLLLSSINRILFTHVECTKDRLAKISQFIIRVESLSL